MSLLQTPAFSVDAVNETTLQVNFQPEVFPEVNPQLAALIGRCREAVLLECSPGVTDCVASYTSLLIYFDCLQSDQAVLTEKIRAVIDAKLRAPADSVQSQRRLLTIPVWYSPQSGPDLTRLADHSGLSIEQLIQLHCQTTYTVYATGFAPGFAYLGFVDPAIACPRLPQPRLLVPAGSVGIADRQTGIYPSESPGGWNIVGRTPLTLLDSRYPDRAPPFAVGDQVVFSQIGEKEFADLQGRLLAEYLAEPPSVFEPQSHT